MWKIRLERFHPSFAHCVYGCAWYVNIVEDLDYTKMPWIANLCILIKASIKTDAEIFLSLQMLVAVLVLNVSVYASFHRIFADEMFLNMVDEISQNLPVLQISIRPTEQYANQPLKVLFCMKEKKPTPGPVLLWNFHVGIMLVNRDFQPGIWLAGSTTAGQPVMLENPYQITLVLLSDLGIWTSPSSFVETWGNRCFDKCHRDRIIWVTDLSIIQWHARLRPTKKMSPATYIDKKKRILICRKATDIFSKSFSPSPMSICLRLMKNTLIPPRKLWGVALIFQFL